MLKIAHEELTIVYKEEKDSEKEWVEIEQQGETIARVNILRKKSIVIIKFLTVHPKYERQGVASYIVNLFKRNHKEIVAQGVKYKAIGFWSKLGFSKDECGKNYKWSRRHNTNTLASA